MWMNTLTARLFTMMRKGTVNLRAAYNSSGKITGLSTLAEEEAQKSGPHFFKTILKVK